MSKAVRRHKPEPIGETLRRQRIDVLGYGLREMARQMKITPAHLSDIETGRRNPSESVMIELAKHYKLDLAVLRAGWSRPEAIVAEVASRDATFAERVPELLRAVESLPPNRWDELIEEAKRLSRRRGK